MAAVHGRRPRSEVHSVRTLLRSVARLSKRYLIPDRIRTRGRLPHWELQGAIYFITFNLADALPRHVAEALIAERAPIRAKTQNIVDRAIFDLAFQHRFNLALDECRGACPLARPECAEIVFNALRHFDGSRYTLHAFCVMPNHVHVLVNLAPEQELERVVHSWKWFTGNRINDVLGRSGRLWQREAYDRIVRDEREYGETFQYILNNPFAVGLRDWRWVWPK